MRSFHTIKIKNNNNKNVASENVHLAAINYQSKRVHDYNKRVNQWGDISCKVCGDAISENAVVEKKAYLMNAMKNVELKMNPVISVPVESGDYNISITYYESPKICGGC